MDVFAAIKKRRSVRAYRLKPVPDRKLKRILGAARLAPSSSNRQPWRFIIVTDEKKRKKLSEGRYAGFLTQAPIAIVGCGDTQVSAKWCVVDVTIAMQNLVMAATAEGLGTCWIGSFDEASVKKVLNIPEHYAVVALLSLGYPEEKSASTAGTIKTRKKLEEICSLNQFGNTLKLGP